MDIALAQINPTVGAFEANFDSIAELCLRAAKQDLDMIVFPELATTGYPPRDLLLEPAFVQANLACVERVRELTAGIPTAVVLGFVEPNNGPGPRLRNAVALIERGRIVATRYKTLLPNYDVFDEQRYFAPAQSNEPVLWRNIRLGLTVCEDLWLDLLEGDTPLYTANPVAQLCQAGVDLLINISASPFAVQKAANRLEFMCRHAKAMNTPVVYLNQVGGQDELVFDGHSLCVNPTGTIAARGRDFAEDFLVVSFDASQRTIIGPLHPVSQSDEEQIYKALTLGLRDYARRCGFSRAVLGLSGGIDSAVTAVIAADALGADNVDCLAMPTSYSSTGSITDSQKLAQRLGVNFRTVSVDHLRTTFLQTVKDLLPDRPLGLVEENLQARIRGTLLMAHANATGSLLLATGNKSELAVGYCTLYGDMCGGLAVIGDLSKTMVYRLARWMNLAQPRIPSAILEKVPSAELRPNQKDSDSLPDYAVLDQILAGHVDHLRSPAEIAEHLAEQAQVTQRWVNATRKAEHKRFQAPPVLRVTGRAFGTGRRLPLSAHYDF
ncbi:MAG: NAD+ synthase [Myxococcales bacterium]|nr:NAD+ synthase [Myxococcales bacterium]